MIKTILNHYIVDKFIEKVFDDLNVKINPIIVTYTEADFYIGQVIPCIKYHNLYGIISYMYDVKITSIYYDLIVTSTRLMQYENYSKYNYIGGAIFYYMIVDITF